MKRQMGITEEQSQRLPLRRVMAGLIDNTLIIIWAGLLAVVSFSSGMDTLIADKRIGYLIAFFSLTLPVVLVFSLFEASQLQATPGKRIMALKVVHVSGKPAFTRALLRNAIKFLPWEIAHIGIWLIPGQFLQNEPETATWILCLGGEALAIFWLVSLFLKSGRTPYDRVSGLTVARR